MIEGLCVSPKASGFCPFGYATGLEESGGRAVASVKGCFFMFFVFVPPVFFH